jgi:hypothetical protein
LRDFDRAMNGRGVTCVRYIDDFLLLGPNQRAIEKAFGQAQKLLMEFGLRAYEPPFKGKAEASEKGSDQWRCLAPQNRHGFLDSGTRRLSTVWIEFCAVGGMRMRSVTGDSHSSELMIL